MAQGTTGKKPGFNFTDHMRVVCTDMVARVPALARFVLAIGKLWPRKKRP